MNTKTLAIINGIYKSVTMWAAIILGALGQAMPFINPENLALAGIENAKTATHILTWCAIVMAACRLITKSSLAVKGGLVTVIIPSIPEQTTDAIVQKPIDSPVPPTTGGKP